MSIIKIIKKRIRPTITKRFICENCGYVWKAEKGEYNVTSHLGVRLYGLKAYYMNCPCYGAFVNVD